MKLYLIHPKERVCGWDKYEAAVVASTSAKSAALIHPNGKGRIGEVDDYGTWTSHPADLVVEYLGEAKPGTKRGVICASFRNG